MWVVLIAARLGMVQCDFDLPGRAAWQLHFFWARSSCRRLSMSRRSASDLGTARAVRAIPPAVFRGGNDGNPQISPHSCAAEVGIRRPDARPGKGTERLRAAARRRDPARSRPAVAQSMGDGPCDSGRSVARELVFTDPWNTEIPPTATTSSRLHRRPSAQRRRRCHSASPCSCRCRHCKGSLRGFPGPSPDVRR